MCTVHGFHMYVVFTFCCAAAAWPQQTVWDTQGGKNELRFWEWRVKIQENLKTTRCFMGFHETQAWISVRLKLEAIVRVLTSKRQRVLREFYCVVVDGMTAWIHRTHGRREDTVDKKTKSRHRRPKHPCVYGLTGNLFSTLAFQNNCWMIQILPLQLNHVIYTTGHTSVSEKGLMLFGLKLPRCLGSIILLSGSVSVCTQLTLFHFSYFLF